MRKADVGLESVSVVSERVFEESSPRLWGYVMLDTAVRSYVRRTDV
jgi:hypothetical protein